MIRTIYKCDKCGNEQGESEQLWTVGITASTVYCSTTIPYRKIEVCRPCLESFGICVTKKKDVEPPKPPTVEELIREIISMVTE